VGVITDVLFERAPKADDQDYCGVAHVDLMGAIDRATSGEFRFCRGVNDYPTIADPVAPLTKEELRLIFGGAGAAAINVGRLQQDTTVEVYAEIDEMLSKHFAVLGSTGVGKSSGVARILLETMRARPELRIFMLDSHNEYGHCFGERAHVVNPGNLRLPFWLFNFEEIVDVLFGGRPGSPEEIEILSEIIPLAKASYTQYRAAAERPGLKRFDAKSSGYTVDTPVPYRLADMVAMIDERMGKLENRSSRMIYNKLITRIDAVSNDPRYVFMFENANVGGDTMAEAISQLFRLPPQGKTVTVMQIAGFPAEVVDAVVSVLARLAFDFGQWSNGSDPLLFVCEEAHKYASTDRTAGFAPTRRAISRIAKEGRKYGVYLGLVTQRPAELDPTIISQCGTLFAMRMSNDRDQALLRSAVSDATANLLAFVPTLGTRETLAFGAGFPLPTRLTFAELPANLIPRSEAVGTAPGGRASGHDLNFVATVIERWRSVAMNRGAVKVEAPREAAKAPAPDAPPLQPAAPALDPNRFSLLKRPVADQPDPLAGLRRPIAAPPNR
jgi:DNA helicase HerA-like ATPase